jgi:hypothetical protein
VGVLRMLWDSTRSFGGVVSPNGDGVGVYYLADRGGH